MASEGMASSGKQLQRANDMLERIASDEIFAKNVRSLSIHGYSQRAGNEGIYIMKEKRRRSYFAAHLGLLLQAVKNLSSLRSLRISQSDLEPSVVRGILKDHSHLQTLSFG